ncbi:MAG: GNAT family N-acetyltransferase [Saprospiraceae bacterium]
MELKVCKKKDLESLITITQTTYRAHYQYLWKDKGEQYIQANYSAAALTKELKDKNVNLYFITEADEIYGFLKLQINAPLDHHSAKDALELARIYLLKKAMGKGLGKAVMQAVREIGLINDKKVIWLKTMDSSDAVQFYQRCGYEICGATRLVIEGLYPELQRQLIMKKEIKKQINV